MATLTQGRKVVQTWSFRGSKSRNKVSVGEPAEGSLLYNRGAGAVADFVHAPVLSHNPSHPLCASPRGCSPFGFVPKGGICVFIQTTACVECITICDNAQSIQLSTTDLLALASMKNAAKCDT